VLSIRDDHAFWSSLDSDLLPTLDRLEPADRRLVADEARLGSVAEAFALVVDAKSPYTFRHSARVAQLARAAGERAGLAAQDLSDLHRAGLLHDIGKLAIPNSILDKAGPLTDAERSEIERHPEISRQVLERVPAFARIAELAAAHHEKLDGSGYPRGLTGAELSESARLLAVADVYEALTADRPYRRAMSSEVALAVLRDEAEVGKLCVDSVGALEAALGARRDLVAA